MFALDNIEEPKEDNTHANRIKLLKNEGLVTKDIDDILYSLRIARNKAAHDGYESTEQAKILLEFAHKLGAWFMGVYGDWDYEPEEFIAPEDSSKDINYEAALKGAGRKNKRAY